MSKEFNPDEFLETTAPLAEAQADIERRNAEREAIGQGPLSGAEAQPNMNPSGPANIPVRPTFSEAPGDYLVNNAVAPAYGVVKGASEIAAAHPTATMLASDLALAALPKSIEKVPVLGKAVTVAKYPYRLAGAALDALKNIGGNPTAPVPTAPVPTAPVAPSPIIDAQGRPMQAQARPVAPAPVAQAAEQGLANRIKQTAASRITGLMPSMGEVLGTAGRVASRVLGPAALALESRDLGPKTPQTGRMKGMEINPLTNAPWTPDQIAQYEANPAQYDQQMSPPQFRR